VLVEVVEHHLGDSITLENNDEALTGPTRSLVPDVGNSGEFSVFDQISDLDRQVVRVHLIGKLGDHKQVRP
jgi:hypothetical protein